MTQRSPDDLRHELQVLDQAHAQNEAARDSFVALAHTALFAASVSFVGSAVPLAKAVWSAALILGWALDVVGLLSLTGSFVTARKAIDARRTSLFAETPPLAVWSDRLNCVALWSFPPALLCLFSFVVANVIHINDQPAKPSIATATRPIDRIEGHIASTPRAAPARRSVTAANGRGARSKSPGCATTSNTSSSGTHGKVDLKVSRQGSLKTHLAGPVATATIAIVAPTDGR